MSQNDDIDAIADESSDKEDVPEDELYEAIAELQEKSQEEQDKRLEERFLWIVAFVVIFDAFVFSQMQNWGGPIALAVIQILGLLILARKCGVEEVSLWLDKVLNAVKRKHDE